MFPFELDKIKEELEELEHKSSEADFWEDLENSQKVLQKIKSLNSKISRMEKIKSLWDDILVLIDLGEEEEDLSVLGEIKENISSLKIEIEDLKLDVLLTGKYDKNNAILTLHSGAGGTEACDWVAMLFRMYTRWALKKGYLVQTIDILDGEEAGIKSVTFMISGENAYGYLKAEKGVHRLIRISPFDASGRRHTSFASLDVMPELDDDVEVNINPDDLRIDTYRASGAGGQHINKTSSAVRITHIPTGIVVASQAERSQFQNKDIAMKMLKSKLVELKEQENKEKIEDLKGVLADIAWGSQIRSYIFCPYTLVKDHRTNCEDSNVDSVMDGNIDEFIRAFLAKGSQ